MEYFPKNNLLYYNRGNSIADLVAPYVTGGNPNILDIGAGFGHILCALGDRFPKARKAAIEFSHACVRHLESLGFGVYNEPADEVLSRIDIQFDLVVISHVFEHLLNPRDILQLIQNRLAPGGNLYLEVPNIPADFAVRYPDHV